MILNYAEYRNKVLGCWMGKNIGGTLGAPMEWRRQKNDVSFYTQDLEGEPLPNDDLDLQLAWLLALERYGPRLNSRDLVQYWLSLITPHWVEYGVCKSNLKAGLLPPISGWFGNLYKDSCGAFIRSEIWSCITPGCPTLAAEYMYEDATVDHADEGLYAAIYCAIVQSAAFVENDKHKLISLGLSALPEDCGVARGIQAAVQAYKNGKNWQQAREDVLREVPSVPEGYIGHDNATFTGYDAPNNLGFMVIGWLYGEEDFGKSLCITVNCGDDTDCTAATLGAILGIINGIDGIPEKWKHPIGKRINTITLNRADERRFPKDIEELTDRVMNMAYQVLAFNGAPCRIRRDSPTDVSSLRDEQLVDTDAIRKLLSRDKWEYTYDFGMFRASFSYEGEPIIQNSVIKPLKLTVENTSFCQQSLTIRWILDEKFSITPSSNGIVFLAQDKQEVHIQLSIEEISEPSYRCFVEIVSNGYPVTGIVPFVLLNGNYCANPYKMRHVQAK